MTYTIILLVSSLWLISKFILTKNYKYLFLAIMFSSITLSYWPLYLPFHLTLGIWSVSACGIMIYEHRSKKYNSSMNYFYILLFITFALVFFLEGIHKKFFNY